MQTSARPKERLVLIPWLPMHGPAGWRARSSRLEERPSGSQKDGAATRMGSRGSVTRAANSPREASPEMMAGLIDLAKNAVDERVRSVCLIAVLDRAGVRPIDYDPAEDAAARQPKFDPSLATQRRRQRTSAPKTTSAQSNDVAIYRHRSDE